jgi:SAM-dependent methyltransferase
MNRRSWRERFVRAVYADQNDSSAVRGALDGLLRELGSGRGLNVGSGPDRIDTRLIHLDLARRAATDCVADARFLPFSAATFDLVLSQETIEHVADPFQAVREMVRVLRPQGKIYLQVPFVIGYHPGPEDYWRFTRAGISELLRQAGIRQATVGISVGPGTGFYRIAVEFLASVAGRLAGAFYLPVKGAASLLCYPLKWLDRWLLGGIGRDRIAGGYLAIGRKPHEPG